MEGPMAALDLLNEKAFQHIKNNVVTQLTCRKIGLTFCALTDIYKGQEVFLPWDGPTREYSFIVDRIEELHGNVFGTLLRYFDNHSYLEKGVVNFKLVHGVNFIVAQPECILSPDGEGGNLESGTIMARWDIIATTELSLYEARSRPLL